MRLENGKYLCFDGYHRLSAHKDLKIPQISAGIYQCDAATAERISYESNLGRPWTEAEKGNFVLKNYQKGFSVTEIVRSHHFKSAPIVNGYIRRAYWLEPSIHNRMGNGVNDSVGNILLEFTHNEQLAILSSGQPLTAENVRDTAIRSGFKETSRDIRSIPKIFPTLTSPQVQVTPQPEAVDPRIAELQMLRTNIQAFCQKYGYLKEQVLSVL